MSCRKGLIFMSVSWLRPSNLAVYVADCDCRTDSYEHCDKSRNVAYKKREKPTTRVMVNTSASRLAMMDTSKRF
jgi:hypothetical protein